MDEPGLYTISIKDSQRGIFTKKINITDPLKKSTTTTSFKINGPKEVKVGEPFTLTLWTLNAINAYGTFRGTVYFDSNSPPGDITFPNEDS